MDFLDFTKLLVRRWWVSVPLLLITLGLTVYTYTSVKPNYTTNAYVILVPPRPQASDNKPGQLPQDQRNVWLSQGLPALANAASITVTEPTAAANLSDEGFSSSFTVQMSNSAAMVTFAVTGNSAQQANTTADELVRIYTASVKSLQDQVAAAPVDQIQAKRLGADASAVPSSGNVKRAAVAVFGAGVLMTAGITVAVDALFRRRARRRVDADMADLPPSGAGLPPTGGLGPAAGASPVSPAMGDPVRSRATDRSDANPGVVPTYRSVYTGARATGTTAGRDATGITVEEVLTTRARPAADSVPAEPVVAQPATTSTTDAPTDVTVVLPLKIWPGRDAENGRRG